MGSAVIILSGGISNPRNETILKMFTLIGLGERRGSGFKKIRDAYQGAPNFNEKRAPRFTSDVTDFVVVLPNLNYGINLGDSQFGVDEPVNRSETVNETVKFERIIEIVRAHPGVRMPEIMRLSGLSRASVNRHFAATDGMIVFRGAPKMGGYYAVE